MTRAELRQFARAGAQARLEELQREIEAIRRAFPDLRTGSANKGSAPSSAPPRRRRSTMSAAQRKAVGERMKKYWATRRGESAAAGTTISDSAARTASSRGTAKRDPRTMSAAARKRISQAQKKRWAAKRKAA